MLAILALALMPGGQGPDWFAHADKVRHAAAFLLLWAIGKQARFEPAWCLAVALLAFGIGIECFQALTPTRESSWGDVLADVVGIALGHLVVRTA
ncbi:VanZ family protein [Ideonella sp. DXS29W]|uniref:VanZ family protein n=1 Tax=Ideonella lacteola TaxID=2984193 RepID=A0ABU9BPN7_9BURK